jgi:hypothetical protein
MKEYVSEPILFPVRWKGNVEENINPLIPFSPEFQPCLE